MPTNELNVVDGCVLRSVPSSEYHSVAKGKRPRGSGAAAYGLWNICHPKGFPGAVHACRAGMYRTPETCWFLGPVGLTMAPFRLRRSTCSPVRVPRVTVGHPIMASTR